MELSHLRELTLIDLANMDGERIGIALKQALMRVADDIHDRPGEKKARTVALNISLSPEVDDDGQCENVKMQCQIKDSIPTRKTRVYDLGVRRRNGRTQLVFSDAAPDNHRQPGLPMDHNEAQ
ncbi:hypothetical protein [Roseiconus lacunae]|uniref:Uncharacterized protein n=1 Tax=Roseiconus lacunae TaxID=2605694 RepID=A0ABT7PI00_9BACT|nr:hypothetical protein [Roseiconus lacunae]MDM4015811.1 hypothetical protein [Roseiconus lacunae]